MPVDSVRDRPIRAPESRGCPLGSVASGPGTIRPELGELLAVEELAHGVPLGANGLLPELSETPTSLVVV
jgi:hypothetical protein